jgi:cyclohexa-1,5-dienecarbonyl-CoA hydratase
MSEFKCLEFEKEKGVARITLARPPHNVLNIEMINEFNSLLDQLIADDELKCLVILGKGKSWCAGVEVGDHKPEKVGEMIQSFSRIFELMNNVNVPTIAAVHGTCLGGGMELAIACDIIIASDRAKFGQPEIKLGFFPPYAVVRLPELVGPAKTIEICTSGKVYSSEQALSMGFVSHTAKQDEFSGAVDKMTQEISYSSPLIIRLNKLAVRQSLGVGFAEGIEKANNYFLNTLMKTADTMEGIKSFEEKRKPEWRNQ